MKDKIRDITITEVANGYLVKIGCCIFIFKQDELLEELTEYIREPRKMEIRYMKELGIRDDLTPFSALQEPLGDAAKSPLPGVTATTLQGRGFIG